MVDTTRADAEGRIILPEGFANTTLIVERLGDSEVRIRKPDAETGEDVRFREEQPLTLSDRDRDALLALIDEPPAPNEALIRAFRMMKSGG